MATAPRPCRIPIYVVDPMEDLPVNIKANPLKPTIKHIEEHNIRGHVPYRSWCEECVKASGRSIDHSDNKLPTFACDYAFLTSETDK